MLFSSTTFIYLFLPAALFFYYVVFRKSRKLQNVFLLLASLFFYAWGEPRFVLVMMASIALNWAAGGLINKFRDRKKLCRLLVAADAAFNLGLLFVFKYLGFAGELANGLLGAQLRLPQLALPIGISFFTFQAMSYVIDVYRGNVQVQKNILCVGLYISFFPQLIAGPIVRYETVADEIQNRRETADDLFDGFARFVVGLAKKVLLANSFAFWADGAFHAAAQGETLSVAYSWLGAIAYTLQIFFDFSGYSDMAIGLGRMFGFHFLENFDYPYISTSISEFWRRWHMSLGSWFRDYLYFPLGGSRVGKARMVFNLFVVWFLTGLWHGANVTFVVWGLMYFVLIAAEKLTGFDKRKGFGVLKWLYTMLFVVIGWVIFRAESLRDAVFYIKSMFGLNANAVADSAFAGYFEQSAIVLAVGILLSAPVFPKLKEKVKPNLLLELLSAAALVGLFVLSVASLVSSSYNPFIYFNF